MKQASLIVDDGEFEIYQSFDEARAFLVANIDWILTHYGETHHICKEDVMIVSYHVLHHFQTSNRQLADCWSRSWGA